MTNPTQPAAPEAPIAKEAGEVDAEAAKKATIAAAMERARAQREAAQPKNTEDLSETKRREIEEIDRRRAPLAGSADTQTADTSASRGEEQ